jgi:PPM family protein phosphatase
MRYVAVAKTDVGRKRSGNEDSFCVDSELCLFVVADGMGGHAAGEVASRLAVETIHEWIFKYVRGQAIAQGAQPLPACSRQATWLVSSIRQANRIVFDAAQNRSEHAGMGTTLVAVLAEGDRVALAHVGDSRIYRIRAEQILQLSKDHSLVQQQMERGIISPQEAHDSQYRHLITRALGLKESVDVDFAEENALEGDLLLLCSDGLSDLLEDEEMLAIIREHADDLEKACRLLVDRANYKGGDDNITALLIQARAGDQACPGGPSRIEGMLGPSAEERLAG